MTLLIILSIAALFFYAINDAYNTAAKTPGTKIYEAKKFYSTRK